jgi:hypothetical protein
MYLKAEKYVGDWKHSGVERDVFAKVAAAVGLEGFRCDGSPSMEVSVNVAYWRKANAIHGWFVKNVQGGKDECQLSEVGREQLEELVKICNWVLADSKRADDLLPPKSGFFFGSTEVDDYYFADLRSTVKQLRAVLDDPRFENWDFYYRASW